jgi:alpha-1,2-mannosyltransferase
VHIQQSDFTVYVAAAHLVAIGHGGAIYSFPVLTGEQHRLFHALLLPRSEAVFLYPPFVAVVLAPLAALPYTAAYTVWIAVNSALVVWVLFALRRYLRARGQAELLWWLAGLSFFPVFAGVVQGQLSIVVLAVLTWYFLALHADHDRVAGAALAVALIKPIYVVPLLLVLLLHRRWHTLVSFAATAIGLLLLPMLVLGTGSVGSYVSTLREASGWHTEAGGFAPASNQNYWGFTHLLLQGGPATAVQVGMSVISLGALALVAVRRREVAAPFGLALVVGVLVSPHVLLHDLSLLLPAAAIALRTRTGTSWILTGLLAAGYWTVLLGFLVVNAFHVQVTVLVLAGLACFLAGARVARGGVSSGHLASPT